MFAISTGSSFAGNNIAPEGQQKCFGTENGTATQMVDEAAEGVTDQSACGSSKGAGKGTGDKSVPQAKGD